MKPSGKPLHILGLGGSIATPKEGITAEVLLVDSFDVLEARGRANVEGKIVPYNVPFTNYFKLCSTGRKARHGPQVGTVAVLVRSVTPVSLQTPHTGAMEYAADPPKIPAVADRGRHHDRALGWRWEQSRRASGDGRPNAA